MDKVVRDAEAMVIAINSIDPIRHPRVWTAKDDNGNVTKVRIYFDGVKGYIDLHDDMTANIESVGRNAFTAAKEALEATGYTRTFA